MSTHQAIQFPADSSNDWKGAALALALMGVCTLVYAIQRASAVRRTFATSRHKHAAELALLQSAVRAQRSRVAALGAACTFVLLWIARQPVGLEAHLVWSVTPALLLTIAMFSLWQLQRLVSLQSASDLTVMAHGHYLFVARGSRLVGWVAAPPSLASSLPVARLRN